MNVNNIPHGSNVGDASHLAVGFVNTCAPSERVPFKGGKRSLPFVTKRLLTKHV
jgi:hypothetical protein